MSSSHAFGPPWETLARYQSFGFSLSVGDTLELPETEKRWRDGDFLRIRRIQHHPQGDHVVLQGWIIGRTAKLKGLIESRLNETYIAAEDVPPDKAHQSLDEIALVNLSLSSDVLLDEFLRPVKRELVITNRPYPDLLQTTLSEEEDDLILVDSFKTDGRLICRFVHLVCASKPSNKPSKWPKNAEIRNVRTSEADDGIDSTGVQIRKTTSMLKTSWRGTPGNNSRLTFADLYCGAGGVTSGARAAGLDLKLALDYDDSACETYVANNPELAVTDTLSMARLSEARKRELLEANRYFFKDKIFEFINFARQRRELFLVDVLHMSPPCQYFSNINTTAGRKPENSKGAQQDDANQACLYATGELLDIFRPLVTTMEQTDGIFKAKDFRDFRALIKFFTDRNYSVGWRRDIATAHGAPSKRKRLIICASCPGIELPPHPAATYGPGTARRFRTINQCIDHLNSEVHTHHSMNWEDLKEVDPKSGDDVLNNIIMCSGTSARHPSGRAFTVRELACLMTLPDDYDFPVSVPQKQMIKQIGNMVPARVAQAVMESVRKTLRGGDAAERDAPQGLSKDEPPDWSSSEPPAKRRRIESSAHESRGSGSRGSSSAPIEISDDESEDSVEILDEWDADSDTTVGR